MNILFFLIAIILPVATFSSVEFPDTQELQKYLQSNPEIASKIVIPENSNRLRISMGSGRNFVLKNVSNRAPETTIVSIEAQEPVELCRCTIILSRNIVDKNLCSYNIDVMHPCYDSSGTKVTKKETFHLVISLKSAE